MGRGEDTGETIDARVDALGFDEDALMARRSTLVSLLRSLHKSLEENDVLTDGPKSIQEERAFSQQAGIKSMVRKPVSTISHRGAQLAQEVHAKFARQKPGSMSFKEFRGYLAAVGRPKELSDVTDKEQSWKMYMDDLGGLGEDGMMTPDGMIKYRALIEEEHGLEMDLLKMKMHLQPNDIATWSRNKDNFDRVDFECVEEENKKLIRRMGKKRAEKELRFTPMGMLEIRSFQQLVADCNEIYTYEQLQDMLLIHQDFLDVMEQMRARYARKNEFSDVQASKIDAENRDVVFRDGFLSWMVSGRNKPSVGKYERLLIRFKTSAVRWMRDFGRKTKKYREDLEKLCTREILTPRLLGGLKMDLSRYEWLLNVGDQDQVDDGMSARLEFSKVERAAQTFAEMKLPRGCGTAVVFDFLARSDAPKEDINAAVKKTSDVITEHFDRDLQKLPLFHSWKVYSYKSDVEEIDVIRLALCFDRTASIDYALRELDLGFSFKDLLTELNCEIKCSLGITDLLDSKRVTLEKDLALRGSFTMSFARGLLVKIFDELLLQIEEEKKTSEMIEAELKSANEEYDRRTAETHPVNPNYGKIVIGLDVKKETKTGQQLETQQLAEERTRRNMWRVVNFLRGTKGGLLELGFKNITESLFGSKLVKSYLPDWITKSFFQEQGKATEGWRQFCGKFLGYMMNSYQDIANHQAQLRWEKQKAEEEESALLGGMTELQRRRQQLAKDKKILAQKLETLGIKMDPKLLKKEEKKLTQVELRKEWRSQQTKSQLAVLDMYNALYQSCIGVHAITVISGTNKFELGLQGLDIFECAPELEADLDIISKNESSMASLA